MGNDRLGPETRSILGRDSRKVAGAVGFAALALGIVVVYGTTSL